MMPKRIQMHPLFNNGKAEDNSSRLSNLNKFQIKNNSDSNNQMSFSNEGILKPKSPILLKRSSLIKYDECIPFADGTDDMCRKSKESIEDKIEKVEKQPMCSLFKTGSISSLKISSLKEQWPSSDFVQSGRCKIRTQSTCNEHRCPLPTTASNGNVGDISSSMAIRSISSVSSQSDIQLSLPTDKATLTSCLSKCDARSKSASRDIMKRMDFTDMSLVESLQSFIRKVPVIGESQERDRILTYFTDRFMECNPNEFIHSDACHTLICALMLLNTDIHGQVSKKRMTCKEFVDNILSNYPDNDYKENDLINVYSFIRKTELKSEDSTYSTNTLRRKFSKLITKSIRPPPETNSIDIDANLLNQQHFISGNIMRKCIKRSFGKKPALGHRGWKLQFASLIGLQLLLFKTNLNKSDGRTDQDDYNEDRISLTDSNISSELLQNDNSSLCLSINNTTKSVNSKLPSSCSRENIQVSVDDVESCIKIHHAFANVVEKLRHKNVFSLRLADQAEYFFKVKSEQLHTWVSNINYAAAILSAPPIVGAGQCGLYKPLLPGYLTDLDKKKQILNHEVQIRHYRESLKKLQMVSSKARAINESNIQFCKYEITRFEAYLKLLTSQSVNELRTDKSISRPDINSIMSVTEPQISTSISTICQSPRSAFHISHICSDPSSQEMTTLRRRPPKVPNVSYTNSMSRTALLSSHRPHHPVLIQPQPQPQSTSHTTDSIVSSLSTRPIVYSPQIGQHLPFTVNAGARPTPSFSRFVEPSCTNGRYQQSSPEIITTKSQPGTKLPEYSPPNNSRHNINQV